MQRTVVSELQKDLVDPLAEKLLFNSTDSSPSKGCRKRNEGRCNQLLERGVGTEVPRAPDELSRQEEQPAVSGAPKPDEVAVQVLLEPQHKGRQGEALVYDVHRMSVLGCLRKSQVKDSSRARTRLLHLPLKQKEGEDTAPAGSVLPFSRR